MGNKQAAHEAIRNSHIPVLSREVLSWLACRSGGTYLDATVGQGGLATLILQATAPDGAVIGLDRDPEAIATCQQRLAGFGSRAVLLHAHFGALKQHLMAVGLSEVDGIVFDLGISSAQLDDPRRGFSFLGDGPLDMRMDRGTGLTAADLLAQLSEPELADLIFRYGEERYARRIARAVVKARAAGPMTTTAHLVEVIRGAVPSPYRHGRLHCATRTFQALRIAVNEELGGLEGALHDAATLLVPRGRMCVIAFHSLEDRIVKRTFRALSEHVPPLLTLLTKKPLVPSAQECRDNPRARSAKLRVAERTAVGRNPCES